MSQVFFEDYPFLPKITPDTQPFWDGCRQHRLMFQKCAACGHVRWPASIICPVCNSFEYGWLQSEGKGHVYSYVVFHRAFHPAVEARLPYVVASVQLLEGPVLLTNIIGCDTINICCDMPVKVVFADTRKGVVLPLFEPCGPVAKG